MYDEYSNYPSENKKELQEKEWKENSLLIEEQIKKEMEEMNSPEYLAEMEKQSRDMDLMMEYAGLSYAEAAEMDHEGPDPFYK